MNDGYSYEYNERTVDGITLGWRWSPDDDWDLVMAVPSECVNAELVGTRMIDGHKHNVYVCNDGKYRAQLVHYGRK